MCLSACRFSSISKVRELCCFSLRITDVSLGSVYDLDLSWCERITDVSMLGSVHKLNLSKCSEITDVSCPVYDLGLSRCERITDVSMLGGVHKLNLSKCCEITDVSCLGSVYDLGLSRCERITDVSLLGSVHKLNLSCCTRITDVSMLLRVVPQLTRWICWIWDCWADVVPSSPFLLVWAFCDLLLCFSFCFWCEIHKKRKKNDLWHWRKAVILHNQDKNKTQNKKLTK